jgi:hypothetical protein
MNTSYRVVCVAGRRHAYEHRLVWERHHGSIPPGYHVHHKNGDRKDNRIENLELLAAFDHHSHHFTEQGATKEHKARAAQNLRKSWGRMPMLKLTCVVCGSDFEKRQHLTNGAAKYCSRPCRSKDYYINTLRPKLVAEGRLKG